MTAWSGPSLAVRRGRRRRRKVAEHLVDRLFGRFGVRGGIVGQGISRTAVPDCLFGLRVENVDHQCPDLVVVDECRRAAKAAAEAATPTPSAPTVVERFVRMLGLGGCVD